MYNIYDWEHIYFLQSPQIVMNNYDLHFIRRAHIDSNLLIDVVVDSW